MALLTLEDAKAQLDIQLDDDDEELLAYCEAVTAVIERHVGPVLNRDVVETVTSKTGKLLLSQLPIVSLTSVVPVRPGGQPLDVSDFYIDHQLGAAVRLDGATVPCGPWTVTYVAGRGETVPPTINLAARLVIQHLWSTQYGGARGSVGGLNDVSVTEPIAGYGYAIPYHVLQLLAPYKSPVGVA